MQLLTHYLLIDVLMLIKCCSKSVNTFIGQQLVRCILQLIGQWRYSAEDVAATNLCLCLSVSMAWCKTAASPLLSHWRYCNLALSHRYGRYRQMSTFKLRFRLYADPHFVIPSPADISMHNDDSKVRYTDEKIVRVTRFGIVNPVQPVSTRVVRDM